MSERAAAAIATARKPLLLDANLLLLHVVGSADRAAIPRIRRLNVFAPEDFDVLDGVVRRTGPLVATPNVLTEVSNLAGQCSGPLRERVFRTLATMIERIDETYVRSVDAAGHPDFVRLGITDVGIAKFAAARDEQGLIVVTVDLELAVMLKRAGIEAYNFNEYRRWKP